MNAISSAPYIPPTDSSLEFDTSNFDKTFLTMDTDLKRHSTVLNQQIPSLKGVRALDDTAFAAYEYAERQLDMDIGKDPSDDVRTPSSAVPRRASLPPCDDNVLESGSDTSSTSISSFDIQDDLGITAMRGISEETGDENISTETAIPHPLDGDTPHSYLDKAVTVEQTEFLLQRVHTLASEPGIKSPSRPSRDARRAAIRHGPRGSSDDWTFLDNRPEDEAPNGGNQTGRSLSGRAVVDKYRLVLRKRRGAALPKKPSWRSPSSSMILGKAPGNANGIDSEKVSPGFLTPLSPTLADIKNRLKRRTGKKRGTLTRTIPQEASMPGRGHEGGDVQALTDGAQRSANDRHDASRSGHPLSASNDG